ncbi:glycoside hydrolase family 172 protein [Mediterraneibacter gnavus]|uniref:glycoside hydrolase family 172 protein n=1 Tax=Mediterraneibacter gnavus TaxID=33038 RepID=UPI0036D3D280
MMNWFDMGSVAVISHTKSRAVNAENPTGEKGKGGMTSSVLGPSRKGSPCIEKIAPGEIKVLADIKGPGVIRHIWATVTDKISPANRFLLRDLVLRIYWDGEKTPSVECPLGDFFCCGFGTTYFVNSMPVVVLPRGGMNCYFVMPFRNQATITLENQNTETVPSFFYQIDYSLSDDIPENTGYFHAQWRRSKITELARDYVILDDVRGSGNYIGTFLAISTLERYWWGEGEMKFYLDGDDQYPTICGTGTEDYFGGAWSFARFEDGKMSEQTYNTPFLGYPFYSKADTGIQNNYHNDDCPPMRAFYRFHYLDPIHFETDIRVTLQQIGSCHAGIFERQDDIASVAYWYQVEPHMKFQKLAAPKDRWPR